MAVQGQLFTPEPPPDPAPQPASRPKRSGRLSVKVERTPMKRYRFLVSKGTTLVYRSVRTYPTRKRAQYWGDAWRRGDTPTLQVGGECTDCGNRCESDSVMCDPCFESWRIAWNQGG